MSHDVFISYAAEDARVAEVVCDALEERGIRTWIAPRNIRAGSSYAAAIADAIATARVFVVVMSGHANRSTMIDRELEMAANRGLHIIPFRIEDVAPEKALEYYLASRQWLDAFGTPLEPRLASLAEAVGLALGTPLTPNAPVRRRRIASARLTGFTAVAVGLVALAVGIWSLRGRSVSVPPTLAVLPFTTIGAPDDNYFAESLTEAVRNRLLRLERVRLIASASSAQYAGTDKPPKQIGSELGADHLLQGTARWDTASGNPPNRVRVRFELVRLNQDGTAETIGQNSFDATASDIFTVQGRMATEVAEVFDPNLGEPERKILSESETTNLEALAAFMKGEALVAVEQGTDTLRKAAAHYEDAVRKDPAFAQARAQLAYVYSLIATDVQFSPADSKRAREVAEEAVQRGPALAASYVARGDYTLNVDGEPRRALEDYRRAEELAPHDAGVLAAIARAERETGDWSTAVEYFRRAHRLNPRSPVLARRFADTLLWMRNFDEAERFYNLGLAIEPAGLSLLEGKVLLALMKGDLAGARAVLRDAPKTIDQSTVISYVGWYQDLFWVLTDDQQKLLLGLSASSFDNSEVAWSLTLARTHALRGDNSSARKFATIASRAAEERLRNLPGDAALHTMYGLALAHLGNVKAVEHGRQALVLTPLDKFYTRHAYYVDQLARIHILLGQHNEAMDQLESLVRMRYFVTPAWLRVDPGFDPLRANPRFQRLIADSQ